MGSSTNETTQPAGQQTTLQSKVKYSILSLLYLHVAYTSCITTEIAAKTSFLANINATFSRHLQRHLWHCICSANFGPAFAAPNLAFNLQRQIWHCICSTNFFSTAFAAPTLALHLQRHFWTCIRSANFGTAFATPTLKLHW